jgi:hypothetical protein
VSVAAKDFQTLLTRLEAFFKLCQDLHLRVSGEKSVIGAQRLKYLGMSVGPDGVMIDEERVKAIKEMKPPQNRDEVRSFLGFVNYYSQFIPHYATKTSIIWDLIKRNVPYHWGKPEQAAFELVIAELLRAPLLAHVEPGKPLVLRTDASSVGIGAVLSQPLDTLAAFFPSETKATATVCLNSVSPTELKGLVLPSGERPILFISHKFTQAEKRMSTIEAEAFAVIYSLDKIRPYLFSSLIIVTDHSNLQWLHSSRNAKLQRWSLALNEIDAVVVHRPGKSNVIADCLSRLHGPSEDDATSTKTVACQTDDLMLPKGVGARTYSRP